MKINVTSLIKKKEIKEFYEKEFKKPNIKVKREILAPLVFPEGASEVGTAFDYMLRFYIRKLNPNAIKLCSNAIENCWVAFNSLDNLLSRGLVSNRSKRVNSNPLFKLIGRCSSFIEKIKIYLNAVKDRRKIIARELRLSYLKHIETEYLIFNPIVALNNEHNKQIYTVYKKVQKILDFAIENYEKFLNNEIDLLDTNLLKSAILLARVDLIYRIRKILDNIEEIDEKEIEDLRNLVSIIDPTLFKAEKICILNPIFPMPKDVPLKGDADLIIDDKLIEIKTTKDLSFKEEFFHQLITYYLMSKIGRIENIKERVEINKIGVYFSRYAHLMLFDVKEIIDENKLPQILDQFKKIVQEVVMEEIKKEVKLKNERN